MWYLTLHTFTMCEDSLLVMFLKNKFKVYEELYTKKKKMRNVVGENEICVFQKGKIIGKKIFKGLDNILK